MKFLHYLRPLIEGTDNKISLRRTLALVFSIDLVRNIGHAVHRWDGAKSLSDLAMVLGLEAGLIAALLGLTSYFNMKERQIENQTLPIEEGGKVL